jgi:multidrug efflux pump subunit AcrA (membrane-fusion protein)
MSDPRAPTAARSTEPGNGELLNRVQQIRLDDQLGRRPAGGGMSWLPWVLCALLALAWAGVAIRSYRNEGDAGPTAGAAGTTGSSAPTGPASSDAALAIPPVKGYLVPARQIAVSPIDVGGRVVELNFVEGGRYEQGFVLAKLDASSYEAARDEAAAMLASAKQRKAATEQRIADLRGDANPPPGSVSGCRRCSTWGRPPPGG